MNDITKKQNDNNAIKLLKASIVAYTKAKYWEIRITYFLIFLAFAYPVYYVFVKKPYIISGNTEHKLNNKAQR